MNENRDRIRSIGLSDKNEITVEKYVGDGGVSLHTHDFIEIAYVESGEGVHRIEGGYASPIEQGDVILLNSGVAHAYEFSPGSTAVIYNCLFDPVVLNRSITKSDDFINIVYSYLFGGIDRQDPGKEPYIVLKKAAGIGIYVREMFTEYTEKQNGYTKVNAANLIRLLVAIFRLKRSDAENGDRDYGRSVADSAIKYMNEYYKEKITCDELASRAYISTGYFHKLFKAATGVTPVKYLQNVRLEKAAELLRTSPFSIQKIVSSVGYSDMKHFYNGFFEKYRMTPGQYRGLR